MSGKRIYDENGNLTVNKLIIVGNGFDLALGLETDYKSFLVFYFKDCLKKSLVNNQYIIDGGTRVGAYYNDELFRFIIPRIANNIEYEKLIEKIEDLESVENFFKLPNLGFRVKFNSELFKKIYESWNIGWVDIEGIYFDLLKKSMNKDKTSIDKLNSDLIYLKEKFEEYLTSIEFNETDFEAERNNFIHQFFDSITNKEILAAHKDDFISNGSTYFLNFNYTDALSTLIDSFKFKNHTEYKVNHIHGKLKSDSHPIIFGFGDEMDSDYKKIEELKDNRYLENIKSFKYFKNGNYRSLMRFLDSENYQVCIYGHSCGLSDRVMLNEIFEHENCLSIKIFFYENEVGENDFTDKTMEVSRHFNNNKLMRKKIVDFNSKNKIPQL